MPISSPKHTETPKVTSCDSWATRNRKRPLPAPLRPARSRRLALRPAHPGFRSISAAWQRVNATSEAAREVISSRQHELRMRWPSLFVETARCAQNASCSCSLRCSVVPPSGPRGGRIARSSQSHPRRCLPQTVASCVDPSHRSAPLSHADHTVAVPCFCSLQDGNCLLQLFSRASMPKPIEASCHSTPCSVTPSLPLFSSYPSHATNSDDVAVPRTDSQSWRGRT